MRTRCLVASLLVLGAASQVLAQEEVSVKKLSYALLPEGKTLPAGVARFRLPYQMASGSETYDKDGNKSDSPVKYTATGGAFVAEYGVTDKISLQWKTDFVLDQKAEMAGNRAWEAAGYAGAVALNPELQALQAVTNPINSKASLEMALTTKELKTFKAKGQCTDETTDCVTFLNGSSQDAVAARAKISQTVSVTDAQVYANVKARAEFKGGRGMGDTILGILYEAYDSGSMFVALAGGVRIPTGKRDLTGTERGTTRGAWEVGARVNVDMLPTDWFMISWQNQSEVGLFGSSRMENDANVDLKRDGVRNVGFVYLKPSLETIMPGLESLRASIGVTYDFDSAEKKTIGGQELTSSRSEMIWNYASLGYSFLGMGLPLQLDVEQEMPNRGKNATIAATKTTVTAKAFARF